MHKTRADLARKSTIAPAVSHTWDQNPNGDVIGNLNVYVHGVVPMRKVVCYPGTKCDRTT